MRWKKVEGELALAVLQSAAECFAEPKRNDNATLAMVLLKLENLREQPIQVSQEKP